MPTPSVSKELKQSVSAGWVLTFIKNGKDFLLKPLVCELKYRLMILVLVHYDGKTNFEEISAKVDEFLVK